MDRKTVFISGASSGIGEALAIKLAKLNYNVSLGARRLDRLNRVKSEIESFGGKVIIHHLDVTDLNNFQDAIDKTVEAFGQIDVLINNAGVMPISYLSELKINEWNQMIDVNIRGVLHGVASVIPHMSERKKGHIINISSMAGHIVLPSTAIYSATKFAVRAISEGIKQEFRGIIKVTTICPGYVKTELAENISNQSIKDRVKAAHETALTAEDIARTIAFVLEQPDSMAINEIQI